MTKSSKKKGKRQASVSPDSEYEMIPEIDEDYIPFMA